MSDTESGSEYDDDENDNMNHKPQSESDVRPAMENYYTVEAHNGEVDYIQSTPLVEHFFVEGDDEGEGHEGDELTRSYSTLDDRETQNALSKFLPLPG